VRVRFQKHRTLVARQVGCPNLSQSFAAVWQVAHMTRLSDFLGLLGKMSCAFRGVRVLDPVWIFGLNRHVDASTTLDCEYVSFGAGQNWLLGLVSCGLAKRRRHCRRRNNKVCTMGGSRRLSLGSGKHTVQKNGGGDVVSFPCVR